jgi:uncharacterized Fe-S cluster protein YjdI/CDGSH-type Zn-finger protein
VRSRPYDGRLEKAQTQSGRVSAKRFPLREKEVMASQRDVKKEYRTDRIVVNWEPAYCIHAANCIRGVPAAFNPRDRPWVHVDAASADEIARVITTCPSGALHFERIDDGPQESVPETTTVTVTRDGPLYLHGALEVRDANGAVIRRGARMALCRCGASRNKPFCDNSHQMIGFRDAGAEVEPTPGPERPRE